jgi:hypothetical protein
VRTHQLEFAEFYRVWADECLRTVLVAAGGEETAPLTGSGLPSHPAAATAPSGAPRLHPSTGSLLPGLDRPLAVGLVDAHPWLHRIRQRTR